MSRYYYDLHVHSCLSPCGDNDSTPNNIAGMATVCGLNIVALTDHNSCKNCPAFFRAAKRYGIIPVAGMELTTAEDIHVVCLFEELDGALAFDKEVDSRRIKIKNRVDIFGDQLILDGNDEIIGTEEYLLPNATGISLEEAPELCKKYNGFCYPAHIDRRSNGIIEVLGTFPPDLPFTAYEVRDKSKAEELKEKFGLGEKRLIVSSDSHRLEDMPEHENFFCIDDEPYSSALVRKRLFELLRSGKA